MGGGERLGVSVFGVDDADVAKGHVRLDKPLNRGNRQSYSTSTKVLLSRCQISSHASLMRFNVWDKRLRTMIGTRKGLCRYRYRK